MSPEEEVNVNYSTYEYKVMISSTWYDKNFGQLLDLRM